MSLDIDRQVFKPSEQKDGIHNGIAFELRRTNKNVMKSSKKYLAASALTVLLVFTLSSCWVAIPSSVRVNHVHTKKDNGLHKGWYKQPHHKKHHHKKHHPHHRHHFAPGFGDSDNAMNNETIRFRLDQPE